MYVYDILSLKEMSKPFCKHDYNFRRSGVNFSEKKDKGLHLYPRIHRHADRRLLS